MNQPTRSTLSDRELEVLTLLSHGYEREEVARKLYISFNTVKKTITNMYRVMKARNMGHAVRIGFEQGWLKKCNESCAICARFGSTG